MESFARGEVHEAVDFITHALSAARERAGSQWNPNLPAQSASKLAETGHLRPFTRYAFSRPRGYPSDALLLNWIYRDFRINRPPSVSS